MAHERFRATLLATALAVAGLAMNVPAFGQTYGSAPQSGATQSAPSKSTATAPSAGSSTSSTNAPAGTTAAASADMAKSLASSDRKFLEQAGQGGVAEVELGKLAVQKAQSKEAKDFAQRMVDDHSKANSQLQQLASKKGLQLPADMDKSSRKEYDKLQKLSGADFDREYMKHMVSDHKKDVKDFQKEAKSTKDGDIKSFVDSTLPTLEDHLKVAQNDENVIKNQGRSSASTATPSSTTSQSPATTAPSRSSSSGAPTQSSNTASASPSTTASNSAQKSGTK
jgi:putative membrane protein